MSCIEKVVKLCYITYKELDESIWRLLHICCIDTEFV